MVPRLLDIVTICVRSSAEPKEEGFTKIPSTVATKAIADPKNIFRNTNDQYSLRRALPLNTA